MDKKIGFIGLGQMGKGMALNISNAGYKVRVFDLDKAAMQDMASRGLLTAESPKELALDAEWIFLSLPNAEIVKSVIFAPDGLLSGILGPATIIDCGTTHPMTTKEIATALKQRGISFLDAPVSGMKSRAMEGTLTIMVGGDEREFKEIKVVLNTFCRDVIYMGESGNGQLTKLINQLLFNINTAALAEILPMAAKLGLSSKKVCDVVRTGTGNSFAFEFFAPLILKNNFNPGYHLESAYKDMISACEISAKHKIPMPVTASATLTYQLALANGLGDENKGAMIKVWEKVLDVEVREE